MSRRGAGARPARIPFWLRPKWVVGHLLALALVAGFVGAGLWQLDRHDERAARNAEIRARAEQPAVPVEELVPASAGLGDVGDLEYRTASLTGTFDPSGEVLIRPRSLDGAPGWHVVTPLVLADGRAVLVTRGFAPLGRGGVAGAQEAAEPPAGEVTVTGLTFPTQERGSIGPTDPTTGTLAELARVDIARIDQQYGRDLLPVYVELATQEPATDGGYLRVVPPPATDGGPHLSYAGQWFLFAGVGAIGWPVLLWRTSRDEARGRGAPPAAGPADGGDGGGDGGGGGGGEPAPDRPRQPVGAGVGAGSGAG